MNICLNDQTRSVETGATLHDLLHELGVSEGGGVAVAINDTVVRRAEWPARPLNESDRVLVIRAAQGG